MAKHLQPTTITRTEFDVNKRTKTSKNATKDAFYCFLPKHLMYNVYIIHAEQTAIEK